MLRITKSFQLIHTDISESFSFTRKDYRYYIFFLNDYFEVVHVYFCKVKLKTFIKFKEYKAMIKL